MSNYWVGDRAGRILGPVGLEVLQDLIRSGRLLGLDKVSRDGVNFSPLSDFPEVAGIFAERHGQDREAKDRAEAQRISTEIGKLKDRAVHEVFGLKPTDSVDAFRASFFALVKRFYPDRVPKEAHPSLRQAYGEMFHFLSRLMAQVEARNSLGLAPAQTPAPLAASRTPVPLAPTKTPAPVAASKSAPSYQPEEFIGWERRGDNRVYCEVKCTLSNAQRIFNAHTLVNIANGGFFLAANSAPPLGGRLEVTLTFDNPVRQITATASVVWENQVPDSRTPRGFGCRFVQLSDEERVFIQQFVKKALSAGRAVT